MYILPKGTYKPTMSNSCNRSSVMTTDLALSLLTNFREKGDMGCAVCAQGH